MFDTPFSDDESECYSSLSSLESQNEVSATEEVLSSDVDFYAWSFSDEEEEETLCFADDVLLTDTTIIDRVNAGVCKMFYLRGYTDIVSPKPTDVITKEGARALILHEGSKFNIENFEKCCTFIEEKQLQHLVIVYDLSVTPMGQRMAANFRAMRQMELELFSFTQMLNSHLMEHRFVRPHRKVTDPTIIRELVKLGRKNLPRMLSTDAIAAYLLFKSGDYIEIERKDGIITYRLVI